MTDEDEEHEVAGGSPVGAHPPRSLEARDDLAAAHHLHDGAGDVHAGGEADNQDLDGKCVARQTLRRVAGVSRHTALAPACRMRRYTDAGQGRERRSLPMPLGSGRGLSLGPGAEDSGETAAGEGACVGFRRQPPPYSRGSPASGYSRAKKLEPVAVQGAGEPAVQVAVVKATDQIGEQIADLTDFV